MNLSIKLWIHFLKFSILTCALHHKLPFLVGNEEILGRELLSSKLFKKPTGRISPNAFYPESGKVKFSVSRLSFAPLELFIRLGQKHAKMRGQDRNFYGFAEISAYNAKKIYKTLTSAIILENPFHAHIGLPVDDGADLILDLARQCSNIARANLV